MFYPACFNINILFLHFVDEENLYNTMDSFSNTVKIVVPEGMVVGVSPDNHQGVRWTHKVITLPKKNRCKKSQIVSGNISRFTVLCTF